MISASFTCSPVLLALLSLPRGINHAKEWAVTDDMACFKCSEGGDMNFSFHGASFLGILLATPFELCKVLAHNLNYMTVG